MLDSLTLSNFLSFRFHTEFQFKRFNLITGLNNSGKSNLCQAIITLFLSHNSLRSHRSLSVSDFQSLLYDPKRPLDLTLKSHLSVNRFLGHSNFNDISQQNWYNFLGLNLVKRAFTFLLSLPWHEDMATIGIFACLPASIKLA